MNNLSWADYFFNMCEAVSKKSKDVSTKVGCIITNKDNQVLSVGFNGFPQGVKDLPERYENRELKYKLIVHSEQNAISIAARNGIKLDNSILWIGWIPCSSCAKSLIQAGIKTIYINGKSESYNNKALQERWKEEFEISKLLFEEAGVIVDVI